MGSDGSEKGNGGERAGDGPRGSGRWCGGQRPDALACAALLVFGALLPLVVRAALGMSHPAGSDPDLWGLYALNTPLGTPSAVPPAFPALVYALHAVLGLAPVPAAALAAWGATALVGPLAYLLARGLGAGRALSVGAAVLALTTPHAATLTVQAQPDTWVMVLLLGAVLALLAAHRWPGIPSVLILGAIAGTAPLWREHGLVVAVALMFLGLLVRGSAGWRAARGVAIGTVLMLSPAVLGQDVAPSWDQPWFARVSMVGEELEGGALPEHATMLRGDERERVEGYYRDGARVRLALYHSLRAVRLAPVEWIAVAAALVLLPWCRRRPRLAPLAGLVPVLPALVIWSGPRHVAVALPVALAICAAGLSLLSPRARWASVVLAALVWGAAQFAWPGVAREVRSQAAAIRDLEDIGTDLCALAQPGDLSSGDLRAFLYCPMPLAPLGDPATDWRVWWVTREPEARKGWVRIVTRCPRFHVYRFHAEVAGSQRPCVDSFPPDDAPYIALQPHPLELAPPCAPDPAWLTDLPAAPDEIVPDLPRDEPPPAATAPAGLDERERRERARPKSRFSGSADDKGR